MRRVLTAKWCLAHLTLVAVVLVMLRLGQWQWDRANSSTGGLQNYAYALQWPLFAVFAIVVYVKTAREELRRDPSAPRSPNSRTRLDPAESGVRIEHGVRIGVSTPAVEVDEDDAEMKAYNARLAALQAASERVEARGR